MSKVLFLLLSVGCTLDIATAQPGIDIHSVYIPKRRTTNNHTIESLGEAPLDPHAAVPHSHAHQSEGITGHSVHIPRRKLTNNHTIEPLGETIFDLQPAVPQSRAHQFEGITGHSVYIPRRKSTNNHTIEPLGEGHLDLQPAVPHSRAHLIKGIAGDIIPKLKILKLKLPKLLSLVKGSSTKPIIDAGHELVTGGDGSGGGDSGTSSNLMESSNQEDSTVQPPLPKDRSLLRLHGMIRCTSHCIPLVYNGYGCYCGFGGTGEPVDGIDKCCKGHDSCYGDAGECNSVGMYTKPYKWTCEEDTPYCVPDADALDGVKSCSDQLCHCDRQFVECLKQFPCPKTLPECPTPWSYWG